jgi:hypothetical protein
VTARLAAGVIAFALLLASSLAGAQQPQRVPAPDTHAATGLSLPPRIATAEKYASTDYGRTFGRPELGYSWNYRTPGLLTATIYVYNLGNLAIPSGIANPLVQGQFQQALTDIEVAAKHNRYEELKPVQGPTDCAFGIVIFRCIALSALRAADKRPLYTALMITGYRNHYLKLRLDWLEGSVASQQEVDRFVQTLVGAIVR